MLLERKKQKLNPIFFEISDPELVEIFNKLEGIEREMKKEEIKRKKRKALEKDETHLPPISPELQRRVDIQMAINGEAAKKNILEEPENNLCLKLMMIT